MNGRTCALARTCFITFKLYRTDASFGLLAMKKRQNRSVILPCAGEIYVVFLQAFQGKCKGGSLMIIVYHIPCESSLYIYTYVYIELVFFGVPILGLFRFTFCFLVTGTLNCPPPNPNARPQVISNAGSTAIYKLLARLCPCHESKICRIMPTSGPPSTSATAASLSRRLVWRRRAESDSHSDGAQKYMCSNRSNSTW